ncbi:glycosyltransferase [Corynebacterium qintianiae]|uniref:Glycosyltransferase n=1 Tax=Corynebacterium qintianiae TaxID=2709392 RepID=A0A7T0PFD5_9CORY|nr:glycosyltransferase [Corynebacterium qintianiae]QPK82872.1 glycosyltransferase [Corynebacterium qintianiae]
MIGIYAHHHGSGHIQRCRQIQRQLAELGEESVILSTSEGADVVIADDGIDDAARPHGRAMTAGGTLHYAPYGNAGLRHRLAAIAEWVAANDPKAFYVDVSVEVGAFVRLMGVPVATLAMPGLRDDAPHQLAYTQADAIIAAWPSWVKLPDHLAAHASRVHAVGGISRLRPLVGAQRDPNHVVVMAGKGGSTWGPEDWDAVEQACPGYRFTYLAGENRVDDPTELLSTAGVVVTAGGQNSIADIAVTGAPAILLPQPRPFIEQKLNARQIAGAGLAVVAESFPAPAEWPGLLERAAALGADWLRWETEGAALRAAEVIAGAANGASTSTIAIISLADASRAGHLTHQVNLKPEGTQHITVALADADVLRKAVPKSHVVAGERNLAAARNLGARTAIERGAEILIFLDADCVASNELVNHYVEALAARPESVVSGPVTYMKPGELRTVAPDPHPARPNPAPGHLEKAADYNLFWSLSFAMRAQTWQRIEAQFGGFDTGFAGYGGEDTDFARNLAAHGVELYWVGGAHAFHQHHPVSSPPWEHLDDILANTAYFHSKWGDYPMGGWLEQFAADGAIELIDATWQRTGTP